MNAKVLKFPKRADFEFANHGSVWLCQPTNAKAERHLRDNVDSEAMFFGKACAVEPRYVMQLASGLESNGFSVEV